MKRLLDILHAIALATVSVVGACVCYLCWVSSSAVEENSKLLVTALAQAGAALHTVNRPCTPGPCGTLAEVNKLTTHTSDLIVQSQLAVRHADEVSQTEAKMLPVWNARFTQTLNTADSTLAGVAVLSKKLGNTADGATGAVNTLNETVAAAKPVLEDADATAKHLDALLASNDLKMTLGNVQKMTADGARISKDAADEADKLAHPNKAKIGFWGTLDTSVLWLHNHLFPPLF